MAMLLINQIADFFSQQYLLLLFSGSFLLLIVGSLIGATENHKGPRLIYGRPWLLRVGFFLTGAWVLLGPVARFPFNEYATGKNFWYWITLALLGLIGSVAVLFFAGPCDITINTRKQTYYARFGWPIFYCKWHGSLNEIAGIRVYGRTTKSNSILTLVWKKRGKPPIVLGSYPSLLRAEKAAQRIATNMESQSYKDANQLPGITYNQAGNPAGYNGNAMTFDKARVRRWGMSKKRLTRG